MHSPSIILVTLISLLCMETRALPALDSLLFDSSQNDISLSQNSSTADISAPHGVGPLEYYLYSGLFSIAGYMRPDMKALIDYSLIVITPYHENDASDSAREFVKVRICYSLGSIKQCIDNTRGSDVSDLTEWQGSGQISPELETSPIKELELRSLPRFGGLNGVFDRIKQHGWLNPWDNIKILRFKKPLPGHNRDEIFYAFLSRVRVKGAYSLCFGSTTGEIIVNCGSSVATPSSVELISDGNAITTT